jgi:hypothetical protein
MMIRYCEFEAGRCVACAYAWPGPPWPIRECDGHPPREPAIVVPESRVAQDPAAALEEQIDSALASELATYPRELIERNLAICRANACDRFTDESNCVVLWRNCDHIRDWFEALCGYERKKRWCERWGKRPE